MKRKLFKIGDRVKSRIVIGINDRKETLNYIGIVKKIGRYGSIGVEFPDFSEGEGHDLEGAILSNKGWWIKAQDLKKVPNKITNWREELK